jgi:CubicO group peptidase (beta-lactamase class C family)
VAINPLFAKIKLLKISPDYRRHVTSIRYCVNSLHLDHNSVKMIKRCLPFALLYALLLGAEVNAQNITPLPRSLPETEGVSSAGISRFLEAAAKSKVEFHSFMFLRHGKVIAEGWWDPYKPDLKHAIYSVSKSFTSTAVGFAVSEGRLSVNDKVVSFFPGELPKNVSPHLAAMTVRDLLNMVEGQEPDPTGAVTGTNGDWVRGFFALPVVHEPGTRFLYNTLGVYVLSAIVQKVTGQKVIDYLTPRLFQPLGIRGTDWEVSPQGINTGGWGIRLKTEDMAKFGQLYLQKGNWNGRQLLPKQWIKDAVTSRSDEGPAWAQHTPKDSSDWRQGYGYLIWRCRHNAFRADGADGQFIIVMPDQDAVIAVTCETHDMQVELNLLWDYLLTAIHNGGPLPADKSAEAVLKRQLAALALPLPPKVADAALAATISGKTFHLTSNATHLTALSFAFTGDKCAVSFNTDTAAYKIVFGRGKWTIGETGRRGPAISSVTAGIPGRPLSRVAGSYSWTDGNTLELVLRYIESPHTQTILCHFAGNGLSAEIGNSFDWEGKKMVVTGQLR